MTKNCYTEIKIIHDDEQAVQEFYEKLKEWATVQHEYCKENGMQAIWLGNLLLNAGIEKSVERGLDYCRGQMLDLKKYDDNCVFIETTTARRPQIRIWQKLTDKYLPGAHIIYTAEEEGCGIHWSNDPEVEGNYCISTDGEKLTVCNKIIDDYSYHMISESKLAELLQGVLHVSETDVNRLIKLYDCAGAPGLFIDKWENILNI